jgi:hypothetical protein
LKEVEGGPKQDGSGQMVTGFDLLKVFREQKISRPSCQVSEALQSDLGSSKERKPEAPGKLRDLRVVENQRCRFLRRIAFEGRKEMEGNLSSEEMTYSP